MTDDWASKIRESGSRSQQAMELYRNQTKAGQMNAASGGMTRYTATTDGNILNLTPFTAAPQQKNTSRYRYTPQNRPHMPSQFSGAPLESASLYGSGQVNEVGDAQMGDAQMGDALGGGGGSAAPRQRRPATPMKKHLMGSAGGGGLDKHFQNQRTASQFQQLQRRGYSATPTPRQRFTA